MVFQTGQPRPGKAGRKPGTPNKRTAEIRDALTEMAIKQLPRLEWQLENMYGAENRSRAIFKLLALVLPRGGAAGGLSGGGDDPVPDSVAVADTKTPQSIETTG